MQDVFLMVRRKKTSIFLDAKESTTVLELKKMVRGITKRAVEDMKLYKDDQVNFISRKVTYFIVSCNKKPLSFPLYLATVRDMLV
jgi:hypothetical protein